LANRKKAAASSGSNNMKAFYAIIAVVAILGVGAILYAARGGTGGMATEPLDISAEDAGALLERAQGVSVGDPAAPVQMIVFSDYMCPACAHWAGRIEQMLKAEFVETGQVHYTYYDYPLGGQFRHTFAVARAARCAGDQGRFWEYHDILLGQQAQWMYSNNTPVDHMLQYARQLDLDMAAFESCLRSDRHADVVTANRLLGETLGVGGTPTIFINGRALRQGWDDYATVRAAVQAAGGV
jgi:protein-disulfide isomerase